MVQPTTPPRDNAGRVASMSPIRAEAFGYDQARHLLWRAGFGGTPTQIQTLVSWGPERSVDHLLGDARAAAEAPLDAGRFKTDIMMPPTAEERQTIQRARRGQDEDVLARLRLARMEREREDRRQIADMQRWWLTRMIETPRPLIEKMTLFWHGHFATGYRAIENSWHMMIQNQLFRRLALGNFGELLRGIIRDPAMLAYLNNNQNRRESPNENLAREIMELFGLGIGRYSERDIREGARALTGYTFEHNEFVFNRRAHDPNPKTILGQTGRWDGDDFVRIILAQPACAAFIARKIYGFYVAELPPLEAADGDRDLDPSARSAIADLARELRGGGYELRPVMRRLLLSEHFYDRRVMGQQIKSPAVLVVGAARSLGAPTRDLGVLLDAMDLMGQDLFHPPSVKGWDGGRTWINTSTLYVRQNVMAYMLTGKRSQGFDPLADRETFDAKALLADLLRADPTAARDPEKAADYLLRFSLGSAPAEARRALAGLAPKGQDLTPDAVTAMLLVITSMPEYQLC